MALEKKHKILNQVCFKTVQFPKIFKKTSIRKTKFLKKQNCVSLKING